MNDTSTVQKLLDDSVQRVPQLRGALVVSADGLLLFHSPAVPLNDGETEKRAAMASSLAIVISEMAKLEGIGPVVHHAVEGEHGMCLFGLIEQGLVIGLYADGGAEGDVGRELGVLLTDLPELLASDTRRFIFSGAS